MRAQKTLNGKNADCWPNREQECLLKAALLQGEECVEALREWEACSSMDDLDMGSFRLLPHLHHNLERQGIEHPLMGTWKGIRRRAWYKNRMLFHRMAPFVERLRREGIDTLILKGAAVALYYHPDPGIRPMQDVDVLIPEERAFEVLHLLKSEGWDLTVWAPRSLTEAFLSFRHSIGFRDPDGLEIDLHWHTMYQACRPGQDRAFWDAALPFDFMGIGTKVLCPTDELLNTCVHGIKRNAVPPIRWVADCMTILRSGHEIDWRRLLDLARDTHVTVPLAYGLTYLKDTFNAPVPEDLLRPLKDTPVSGTERLYYYRLACPGEVRAPLDRLRCLYWRYLHTTARGGIFHRYFAGFLPFLQFYWGLGSPWLVAPYIIGRARGRFVRL
jgi:hypothetical protein